MIGSVARPRSLAGRGGPHASRRDRGALFAALTLGWALAAPPGVEAQTVRGLLLEEFTEIPIELGRISLLTVDGDSVASALADEEGFFSIDAGEPGRYVLLASAFGYRTTRSERIDLEADQLQVIQLRMSLRPIPVEGVVVEGTMADEAVVPELVANGFYDRLMKGEGEFLTPAQIRSHPAVHTPQLFREMVTVEVTPDRERGSGPWNDRIMIKPLNPQRGDGRTCAPRLWIDDVLTELMPGEGLGDAIPKEEIEAIEVYRAPFGAPLRYLGNFDPERACGVVLIWTNRR